MKSLLSPFFTPMNIPIAKDFIMHKLYKKSFFLFQNFGLASANPYFFFFRLSVYMFDREGELGTKLGLLQIHSEESAPFFTTYDSPTTEVEEGISTQKKDIFHRGFWVGSQVFVC